MNIKFFVAGFALATYCVNWVGRQNDYAINKNEQNSLRHFPEDATPATYEDYSYYQNEFTEALPDLVPVDHHVQLQLTGTSLTCMVPVSGGSDTGFNGVGLTNSGLSSPKAYFYYAGGPSSSVPVGTDLTCSGSGGTKVFCPQITSTTPTQIVIKTGYSNQEPAYYYSAEMNDDPAFICYNGATTYDTTKCTNYITKATACSSPSTAPTTSPTRVPTAVPSMIPSARPSASPSAIPSFVPTAAPSVVPTIIPTPVPSINPSVNPSAIPSFVPTAVPSVVPTTSPTPAPTSGDTPSPSMFRFPTLKSNASSHENEFLDDVHETTIAGTVAAVVGSIVVGAVAAYASGCCGFFSCKKKDEKLPLVEHDEKETNYVRLP